MKTNIWLNLGLITAATALVGGCGSMGGNQRHSVSNLSTYLYSDQTSAVDASSVPTLPSPLRLGIAFVPIESPTNPWPVSLNGTFNGSYQMDPPLSENQRLEVMKQISGQLSAYPSIGSAELIASDYLVPRGGFANLDRIREMYGVDAVMLLSFDQMQFTDEGAMTMSYWTIVGLYMVPAEKNLTKTVLEAAVYDIASHRLLFRASGTGNVKGASTPINLSEQLRVDSKKSFDMAATNLTANLKTRIAEFEQKVASNPDRFNVQHKSSNPRTGLFGELE